MPSTASVVSTIGSVVVVVVGASVVVVVGASVVVVVVGASVVVVVGASVVVVVVGASVVVVVGASVVVVVVGASVVVVVVVGASVVVVVVVVVVVAVVVGSRPAFLAASSDGSFSIASFRFACSCSLTGEFGLAALNWSLMSLMKSCCCATVRSFPAFLSASSFGMASIASFSRVCNVVLCGEFGFADLNLSLMFLIKS